MDVQRDIIVVGASSGGIEALRALVGKLPVRLKAALFVVQHTAASSPGVLGDILDRCGRMPARNAVDGEPIVMGEIRVSVPDHHLVLRRNGVGVERGPTENRVRPSVDVLFRSAAAAYGARVIGVVLSGNLSDGAAGLRAIKDCGGLAIAQSPDEAAFADMPSNAIRYAAPHFVGTIDDIATKLVATVGERAPLPETPEHVALEAPAGYRTGERSVAINDKLGASVPIVCTDCGGPLWQVDAPELQFRCAIGHAMNADVLLAGKTDEVARALGFVLRSLDEKSRLLASMARRHRELNLTKTAEIWERKHDEHAEALVTVRRLLESLGGAPE